MANNQLMPFRLLARLLTIVCFNARDDFRLASRRALAIGFKVVVVVDCRLNVAQMRAPITSLVCARSRYVRKVSA